MTPAAGRNSTMSLENMDNADVPGGRVGLDPGEDVLALPVWDRPPWAAAIAALALAVVVLLLTGWAMPFGATS